ncbi:membrane protein, partial [Enterococcus faecium MRSN 4777]
MSTNKIAQLSLLSAACVAGRIAFQFIPNFQPMTAIFLFIVLYLSLKDA